MLRGGLVVYVQICEDSDPATFILKRGKIGMVEFGWAWLYVLCVLGVGCVCR